MYNLRNRKFFRSEVYVRHNKKIYSLCNDRHNPISTCHEIYEIFVQESIIDYHKINKNAMIMKNNKFNIIDFILCRDKIVCYSNGFEKFILKNFIFY